MTYQKPSFLKQGEPARLFPVLSVTSKEGRTTSIVLSCLVRIEEFCAALLGSVGKNVGKRTSIETFTEVVFPNQPSNKMDRPDGLIVARTGKNEWRALVEAKVGNAELEPEQLEKYRELAKGNDIDCVISISNQFSSAPETHPIEAVRKSRSKIPVYHWSWMYILTTADLLISNDEVQDKDQLMLLNDLRRFLSHESAGVKGFDRMPPEWSALNKLVSSGGNIPAKSTDAVTVLEAWHQETKDLSLILSRLTEAPVTEKLPRKHLADPTQRLKGELTMLREYHHLTATLEVPDAAAPIEVVADLSRRSIDVGMTLRAPEDKKSSKARVNWLLRQIKCENGDDLYVRLNWPGRSEATQFNVSQLRDDSSIVEQDKEHMQVLSFHVFLSKRLGARFTQQMNFITDLEETVPEFYADVGSGLSAWKRSAPQIKRDRSKAEDVSVDAISEEAEEFRGDRL